MQLVKHCAACRTEEAVLQVYQTNMLGPLLTTQTFLPLLEKGSKKQVAAGNILLLVLQHDALLRIADACMRMACPGH